MSIIKINRFVEKRGKMMKKLLSSMLVLFFVILLPISALARSDIEIFVDGKKLEVDVKPVNIDGTVFLPVRYIVEYTGSSIEWEGAKRTVRIFNDEKEIVFQVGAPIAYVNGIKTEMPKTFIKEGRTMTPVRFVSEQLGFLVDWEGTLRHVYITTPKEDGPSGEENNRYGVRSPVTLTEAEQKEASRLLNDPARKQRIEDMIALGTTFLGVPYKYGATVGDTSAFDCSSFIAYLFQQQNISFPRTTYDQVNVGIKIPFEQVERGDLLFFDTALNGKVEHVGIYLGNNEMLHVSTSKGVQITPLFDYWLERYVVATRF